jgi:hypothetical protein
LAAPETLILARQLGVELGRSGAGLRAIGPRDAITELAPHIAACKPELLRLLTEPGADPSAPAPPTRQTFGESVETWRPLARAYHLHHFKCPSCIAAGKGYGLRCGAGAALCRAYEDAAGDTGAMRI